MLRIVLDSNILISAVVFGGNPRKVLKHAIRGDFRLCISEAILEELEGVLKRPKFSYPPGVIRSVLQELMSMADFVNPSIQIEVIEEDPQDNRILECAVESKADYIVSGDAHLLRPGKYETVRIVEVTSLLKILTSEYKTKDRSPDDTE